MNNPMRFPGFLAASVSLAVFLTLAACHRGDSIPDTPSTQTVFSAKLIKALDPADLEKRLKAELVRRYERQNTGFAYMGYPMPMGGSDMPPATVQPDSSTPTAAGSNAETTYSTTNVQEKGVDEGDLVKTDGAFIYLARGTHFFILKATPADQSAIISDVDLKESVTELHLSGSKVTVITSATVVSPVVSVDTVAVAPLACSNGPITIVTPPAGSGGTTSTVVTPATSTAPGARYMPYMMYQQVTRVYSYDVTDAAAPILLASFEFPGTLQGSRRLGDTIYLVVNHTVDLPNPVSLWDYLTPGCFYAQDDYVNASKQAMEENTRRINELTLADLLSTYTTTLYSGGAVASVSTSPSVSAGDVYIPEFGNGADLSLVISLDLSGPAPAVASSAVLSSWCRVYMSQDSLYLSSDNNWMWIEPMANVAMPQDNPEPRTAVHKFSVAGSAGKPVYRGSGVVDGWLNDRFSMSDYQGYLRIGTTRGGWWGEGISNQLAILTEGSDNLVTQGTISGIAPGERIYSMRFDGNRGYMVTFRRTDPLFTLDLSDPANPRIAGEITVNGFATYIHLLGADKLLTVGQSADSTGRVNGNKLQLFDVSALASPKLLDELELGPGWSDALYDPHAFLYYEPMGILTIPYSSSNYVTIPNGYQYTYSTGLKVFDIGPASISPRAGGLISAPSITSDFGYTYPDTVDRAVIISSATGTGGNIFALANRSVTVADSAQLSVIKQVALPESYSYGPYVMMAAPGVGTGRK